MKKVLSLALVLVLCAGICSVAFADAPSVGLANPLHESDRAGVLEATGFALDAPEDAEDVSYFWISGDPVIAEVRFTQDGHQFTYRAAGENEFKDISGMYYEWESSTEAALDYLKATLFWNENKEGIILWYDMAPGVMYSLSVDSGADPRLLCSTADDVFVPVQGDAEGDPSLAVQGPVYGTAVYIDGKDLGLRALNEEEYYEFAMDQDTFMLTEISVGDVLRVLYRGELSGGATAVQVVNLAVVQPTEEPVK